MEKKKWWVYTETGECHFGTWEEARKKLQLDYKDILTRLNLVDESEVSPVSIEGTV